MTRSNGQALLCVATLVETGPPVWIESSDIRYNIRRFYTMAVVETGFTKARSLFIRNGGMLRTSKAIRLGVHPRTLYALRDAGELEQVGRGLYRLASAPQLTSPDVIPISMRVPRAVVCLISALAQHGLTTQVPHSVDIALPSHSQIPKLDGIAVRVFWYSEPSLQFNIDIVAIDGVAGSNLFA